MYPSGLLSINLAKGTISVHLKSILDTSLSHSPKTTIFFPTPLGFWDNLYFLSHIQATFAKVICWLVLNASGQAYRIYSTDLTTRDQQKRFLLFRTCCDVFEDGVDGRDADVGENSVDAGSSLIPRQRRQGPVGARQGLKEKHSCQYYKVSLSALLIRHYSPRTL